MARDKFGLAMLFCTLSVYPLVTQAGFNEALAALQTKNYTMALTEARQSVESGDPRGSYLLGVIYQNGLGVPASATEAASWYEKAAQGGVVGALSKLAQFYARGEGVPKDQGKAIAYARRSAQLGDPEGAFFLYVLLTAGPLSYLDASRKPDQDKYQKLAARPISERSLDVEARDALYWAANRNYPLAQYSLALTLGGTIGDGNRERMLAVLAQIPNHNNQALKNYEKIARYMEQLGQTYTSPQLFLDAQTSQTFAGMVQTCGIRDPKEAEKPPMAELIEISISKPISGATYLPSKVPGNEHAYLVSGEWEESWTYRGCGKTANVIVKFTADGMGGAYMSSRAKPMTPNASPDKL